MKLPGLAIASALILVAAASVAQVEHGQPHACPESRAHIEPLLKTVPSDGKLYDLQRQAIDMPIETVIELMGGLERAYAIAEATRANAVQELEAGAEGPYQRFHLDTILRADTLIEILDCLAGQESA